MATCDSCGKEAENLQEFKMFGERRYVCKECLRELRQMKSD